LNTRAASVIGVLCAFVVGGLILWQLYWLLLLVFAGILSAIFLLTLTHWFSQFTHLSHGWSLLVVALLLVALTVGAGIFAGDALAMQMSELIQQVPESWVSVLDTLEEYEWGKVVVQVIPSRLDDLPVSMQQVAERTTRFFNSLVGGLVGLWIVVFIAIYLAVDKDLYLHGIVRLTPPAYRERLLSVLQEVGTVLQWWLLARLIDMVFVGLLTTLGLWMLGIPLALILGVLAALFNFIPNIGPLIAAIPAVLLGLVDSPTTALYVIILYIVIQTVESSFVTPMLQQKAVALPPALTISAQIAFGILAGGLGVVLATPLTAAAVVLTKRLFIEDMLEKPGSTS